MTGPFPDDLVLKYRPELKDEFQLDRDFSYHYKDWVITAPSGMRTDLASIPRAFRWLFKGHNRYTYGAIIHDYLYSFNGWFVDQLGRDTQISRKECDEILYQACIDAGVSKAKAKMIYAAVRAGGWLAWSKN